MVGAPSVGSEVVTLLQPLLGALLSTGAPVRSALQPPPWRRWADAPLAQPTVAGHLDAARAFYIYWNFPLTPTPLRVVRPLGMDAAVAAALATRGVATAVQAFGLFLSLSCDTAAFTAVLTEAGLAPPLAAVVDAAMRARAHALFTDPPCERGPPVGGARTRGV